MTGQKNRSTTTEKLWDLDDKQLRTPQHDELVLLLLDKEYVKSKKICGEFEGRIIESISIEEPIMAHNGFMVGFVDVLIQTRESTISTRWSEIQCPHCKKQFDYDIIDLNRYIERKYPFTCRECEKSFVVTTDGVKPSYIDYWIEWYIECKPQILSLGETVRQIKLYREYILKGRNSRREERHTENTRFILFTPDTRFKDAFETQGIRVVSP